METINPVYARIVARELSLRGIDESVVFQGTGIGYQELFASDALDLPTFRRILLNGEALVDDPPLGFLIGSRENSLILGPMGVAIGLAPTLRASLQILESYTRLHVSYIRVELRSNLDNISVFFDLEGLDEYTLRHHVEASMMIMQHHVERLTGSAFDDGVNRVSYPAPPYAGRYPEFLHSPVEFSAQRMVLEIPQHRLDIRSPYFHREMWQQSQEQLSRRLRELGGSEAGIYSQHVRACLRSYEPPLPGLAEISRQLHLSERTLNRRLQEENTSFRDLRSGLLHEWAQRHLLETGASVESIAATLGYRDVANFRRAFRARADQSPSEYRESQGAGSG